MPDNRNETRRIEILGIEYDALDMAEAVSRVEAMLASGVKSFVVTSNAEIGYLCHVNEALRGAVCSADLVVPDGIGVVYASRILRRPITSRVPGVELGENILPFAAANGFRLFILGGKPGVAEAAGKRLAEKYPSLAVCGTHDGFFSCDEAIIAEINAARADLLYVCLGSPRQELWIYSHMAEINAVLFIGLGGSVDIYSGETSRTPAFWRKLNLEWLWRLLRQPSRAGRVFKRIPAFLLAVCAERRAEKKKVV